MGFEPHFIENSWNSFLHSCNACLKYLNHTVMCCVALEIPFLHTIFQFQHVPSELLSFSREWLGKKECGGLKIPDRLEIIKNQQLINLHRATHFWAWFCLHVSQNKLSAGTPLCDINFISAIKRNVQEVKRWWNFSQFRYVRGERKEKLFPPETVEGKKKLLRRLMASSHDDGLWIIWCEIFLVD